jgi:hypothetical protein
VDSIAGGLPKLFELAHVDGLEAIDALAGKVERFQRYLPAE